MESYCYEITPDSSPKASKILVYQGSRLLGSIKVECGEPELRKLVKQLNQYQASPVHLKDLVEDFLYLLKVGRSIGGL